MDVLLADSDPTSPVSAADLRRLISRLEHHSLRIKSKVHTYLTTHHPHFSSLFSQSTHLLSRSSLLHTHLLSSIQHPPRLHPPTPYRSLRRQTQGPQGEDRGVGVGGSGVGIESGVG
ncbi:hypothetical protein LIER_38818 [Lithospermum erythrorhizon]|uniref:Uncharacterized protein n=1 Tax=Lithospermum erythrorhizon TaxID=34254 RepID=A0AAV3QAE9_LITER